MKACVMPLLPLLVLAGCGDAGPQPLVGILERDRVEVSAEHGERLAEIRAREGETVVAGAVLARQDSRRLDTRVDRTAANRDVAGARLAELVRGPRLEDIEQARATLARTEAEVARAGREYLRIEKLHADGVASATELDTARAARDTARANRDEAGARLESLLEGTTPEELDRARAELRAAEARLAELEIERERLELTAPVAGRVEALPFETGEFVPAGRSVAVLAAGIPYARVYVPETLRTRVAPGQPAEIRLDGRDEVFAGRVRFVATEAAFTPYFALTERDRGRLVYLAEIELTGDGPFELATGVPVEVRLPGLE